MPNDFENRVLVRTNARQLSDEEFQEIMEKGKAQMTQLPSIPFNPDF
jgi:DNA-directed RNA polymerase subunit H (RpoH/RPB5)